MELDKDFSEFVALFIDHDVRDDLIANKKAAGRPQDIADVQRLTQ
jgi:hypothetical protein